MLLDGGATISLIDKCVARKIGLKGTQTDIAIRGVGNGELRGRYERVKFKVTGELAELEVEHAIVIPCLNLPSQSLEKEITKRVSAEWKIDISSYKNAHIGILVGQDNSPLLNVSEMREIKNTGLVASRSLLGWSVHGYIKENGKGVSRICIAESKEIDASEKGSEEGEKLDELINYYFTLENLGAIEMQRKSNSIDRAEQILQKTTKRVKAGWETGLLWKSDIMPAVNSKFTAEKRLLSLETKLDREPEFAALYYKEMDRLFASGYARKIDLNSKPDRI